mgnify:FL=1
MDDAIHDPDGDESAAKPRRPGLPVEPRRVIGMLLPHSKRLGKGLLGAALVSAVAFFFLPKTFKSQAVLYYEGTPLLDKTPTSPDAFLGSAVAPSRLREVRERLGLDVSLSELSKHVSAESHSTKSIRLEGSASTADDAYALAQALLDVFLDSQAAFNAKKVDRLSVENDASLKRAVQRRDAAQAAFDEFRKKSGKPDLLDEKEQLLSRAAELRVDEDEAAVEIAAQRALIEELEVARDELPRQIVSSATRGAVSDAPLARARAELAEARATLSERHPRVQALKGKVARLQAQRSGQRVETGEQTMMANPARTAVDRELATARAALAAAEERDAALRVLLADIQRETEALAPEEGEARAVLGELEAAIARFGELTARGAALRDASLGPSTGFRLLSAPTLPEESARSKSHVMLLLAIPVLVVLVWAIVIVVRGLRTLQVEAPREVAWWGNGPVLGTSVWPRDPAALDAFVDELEDQGVYGAGRTLVVPATETEREIACSFAMRLADAPWLAAAILDVGERSAGTAPGPVVTPTSSMRTPLVTPPRNTPPKRLSARGTPSHGHGRAVPHKPTVQGFVPPSAHGAPGPLLTPAPPPTASRPPTPTQRPPASSSSRPPRKKTVIGLPAVQASSVPPATVASEPTEAQSAPSRPASSGPEPFRRKRGARATVRMVIPAAPSNAAAASPSSREPHEEAFLLTRPVPVAGDQTPGSVGRAVQVPSDVPHADESNAVMRAAVRLLGNGEEDLTELRRSRPPVAASADDVSGVALAWNGPLSGPVLRRAARLAHRVVVVVSSGLSVVDLARVKTRLGRDRGVGYVLVNVGDRYIDVEDRVGPVEEFWQGARDSEAKPGWGA